MQLPLSNLDQSENRGCSVALNKIWLIYFALSSKYLLDFSTLLIPHMHSVGGRTWGQCGPSSVVLSIALLDIALLSPSCISLTFPLF